MRKKSGNLFNDPRIWYNNLRNHENVEIICRVTQSAGTVEYTD